MWVFFHLVAALLNNQPVVCQLQSLNKDYLLLENAKVEELALLPEPFFYLFFLKKEIQVLTVTSMMPD